MHRKVGSPAAALESFIIKQLLTSSGVFKGSSAAGGALTADLFADTLSEAIANAGGLGLNQTLAASLPELASEQTSDFQRVSSPFGERIDPFTGQHAQHTGVDISAPLGTPIPATQGGVVIAAGQRGGYGNAIEVKHGDGTSTLYAHAQGVAVHPGEQVQEGQILGWVGQTGRTTGPHLHLEVRRGSHFIDPTQALKSYRLRDEDHGGGSHEGQ